MSKAAVSQLKVQEEQRRLSKEELLKPRIAKEEVFLESLQGTVMLKSLSHAERQKIRTEAGLGTPEWDEEKFTMLSLVYSVVDPDLTMEDLEALKEQSSAVIDELVTQVTFLNMLGQAGELKKGSSETQS